MRPSILLLLLSAALITVGLQYRPSGLPLIWLGIDFLLLGLAHLRGNHRIFGKRSDGTIPLLSWAIFLPLFLFSGALWHLTRLVSREPAFNQVSDYLTIGRRLLAHEHPANFANYVDLTSEFREPKSFRQSPAYLAFPILDASAPSPEALHAIVSSLRPGPTYIHCAQGHGRTGLITLAILLNSRTASTIDEGLSLLTTVRPAIRLNALQLSCIRAYASKFSPTALKIDFH